MNKKGLNGGRRYFLIQWLTHFCRLGFSSRMKARKVWTPPQMEESARLINMKKNRKLQMGGKSMRSTASG